MSIQDCLTAEDVRARARATHARLMANRIKGQEKRRLTIKAKIQIAPPVPPVEPEKPSLEDKDIIEFLSRNPDFVKFIKSEMSRQKKIAPTITRIKELVCERTGISIIDIESTRRDKRATLPRQLCFLLCKMLTTSPFSMIGRYFGDRDHTTVMHGVKKLEWLRQILDHDLTPNHPVEIWVEQGVFYIENHTE